MIDFFAMDASNGLPIQHRDHPTAQARIAAVAIDNGHEQRQHGGGDKADSIDNEFEAF
ncbi:MAG: hypothetical protein AB1Z51_01425 [Desulfuromonadales bacterium]